MPDLTRLPAILRAAGLKVVEIDGWQNRGRPGAFAPTGVLCHHTAGKGNGYSDAKAMATNGRPDLKAPLCQLALDRQGVWYVCAAGRANHAGRCKPVGGLKAYGGGRSYGDGNAQMIGVEAQNDGKEPWPAAQYDAYVRGVAAITDAFGWRAPLGHKETSLEGKPDPHFDMAQFRRDVAAATKSPTAPVTSPEEDDMPLTEKDYDAIADRVWQKQLAVLGATDGRTQSAAYQLTAANVHAYRAGKMDPVAIAKAVAPMLAAPGQSGPVTDEQLETALRKVLGSLDDGAAK